MLLLFATPAEPSGFFYSGNRVYEFCGAARSYSYSRDMCVSYVAGAVDGLDTLPVKTYCFPTSVTIGQVADIFTNRLTAKPEERHEPAAFILYRALVEAFPCRR